MKDLCECNSFVPVFLQQCPVTMCSGRRKEECVSWEYCQPQAGLMRLLGCIANFAPVGRLASIVSLHRILRFATFSADDPKLGS